MSIFRYGINARFNINFYAEAYLATLRKRARYIVFLCKGYFMPFPLEICPSISSPSITHASSMSRIADDDISRPNTPLTGHRKSIRRHCDDYFMIETWNIELSAILASWSWYIGFVPNAAIYYDGNSCDTLKAPEFDPIYLTIKEICFKMHFQANGLRICNTPKEKGMMAL